MDNTGNLFIARAIERLIILFGPSKVCRNPVLNTRGTRKLFLLETDRNRLIDHIIAEHTTEEQTQGETR